MSEFEPMIGVILGQYEIVRLLGKGGMATVYEAVHTKINRKVAIKVLPRTFLHDDTFMQRFQREAEVIAKLEHFHILPIYDYGEYDGMPFIVMRYMEGGTLQDRIKQGPLEWDEIVHTTSQIAQALDYAHSNGVVHRDMKPSNVMLDAEGNAYLADFGIARVLEGTSQLTGSGIVGTPAYMSPEQSDPGAPTPAMDIYALGVTVFEMITGRLPYLADTPIAQILMHIQRPVPSLLDYNPEIPFEVDAVMQRAMAKSPAARYGTAGELASALEEATSSTGGWRWTPDTLAQLPKLDLTAVAAMDEGATAAAGMAPSDIARPVKPKPIGLWVGLGAAGLVVLIIIILGVVALTGGSGGLLTTAGLVDTPTDTPAPATITATSTPEPSMTPLPTSTATPEPDTPTPSATLEPTNTTEPTALPPTITQGGAKMLLVQAGAFIMGNDEGYPNERPAHEVYLDAYYIDETEVTNLFYKSCVDEGPCEPPIYRNSRSYYAYYGNEFYHDYPVINISWYQAQDYCRWRGVHLPTEAQWEKAARWNPETGESYLFPWGSMVLSDLYLNYGAHIGDTMPVRNYPRGMSPVGAYEMAGNVSEWVFDWYALNFYEESPYENPTGPANGETRVHRGGSFDDPGAQLTTTHRLSLGPATTAETLGFRCAWTPSGDPTQ